MTRSPTLARRGVLAAASAAALKGEAAPEAVYFNTCYSHVGPDYGISIVGIFRPTETAIVEVPNSGGVSPRGDLPEQRKLEAAYADAWYRSITRDAFS
jgi:sulfide dehydrogenase [flavocytochrome c] flavoprotein subunit